MLLYGSRKFAEPHLFLGGVGSFMMFHVLPPNLQQSDPFDLSHVLQF